MHGTKEACRSRCDFRLKMSRWDPRSVDARCEITRCSAGVPATSKCLPCERVATFVGISNSHCVGVTIALYLLCKSLLIAENHTITKCSLFTEIAQSGHDVLYPATLRSYRYMGHKSWKTSRHNGLSRQKEVDMMRRYPHSGEVPRGDQCWPNHLLLHW